MRAAVAALAFVAVVASVIISSLAQPQLVFPEAILEDELQGPAGPARDAPGACSAPARCPCALRARPVRFLLELRFRPVIPSRAQEYMACKWCGGAAPSCIGHYKNSVDLGLTCPGDANGTFPMDACPSDRYEVVFNAPKYDLYWADLGAGSIYVAWQKPVDFFTPGPSQNPGPLEDGNVELVLMRDEPRWGPARPYAGIASSVPNGQGALDRPGIPRWLLVGEGYYVRYRLVDASGASHTYRSPSFSVRQTNSGNSNSNWDEKAVLLTQSAPASSPDCGAYAVPAYCTLTCKPANDTFTLNCNVPADLRLPDEPPESGRLILKNRFTSFNFTVTYGKDGEPTMSATFLGPAFGPSGVTATLVESQDGKSAGASLGGPYSVLLREPYPGETPAGGPSPSPSPGAGPTPLDLYLVAEDRSAAGAQVPYTAQVPFELALGLLLPTFGTKAAPTPTPLAAAPSPSPSPSAGPTPTPAAGGADKETPTPAPPTTAASAPATPVPARPSARPAPCPRLTGAAGASSAGVSTGTIIGSAVGGGVGALAIAGAIAGFAIRRRRLAASSGGPAPAAAPAGPAAA
eukprot:tig00021312_g20075.t1